MDKKDGFAKLKSAMKKTLSLVALSLILLGAGCSKPADPYIPAEAPTQSQLSQMTDVEKERGLQDLLKKYPMPGLSPEEKGRLFADAHRATDQGTVERRGSFRAGVHSVNGSAELVKVGNQTKLVFSDNFSVDPGPFLVVNLSSSVAPKTNSDFTSSNVVQLELIKSATGGQVYDIPSNVDVSQYKSVVIYCKPYQVVFAYAPLQ